MGSDFNTRMGHSTKQLKVSMLLSIWRRHSMVTSKNQKVDYHIMSSTKNFSNIRLFAEFIVPAVQGTVGMLKSAVKNGLVSTNIS